MARADLFSVLYAKKVSPMEFNWDSMVAPPLLSFLTVNDIYQLYMIAKSNKLASKPKQKYQMIDNILRPRGFRKIASGTNRVVYKYLDDQRYCIKVAYDRVALLNNPAEFRNQFKLKPFVARVFEVSPCGTVALCERVEPITTREEFANIANDIYDLLVNKIIGKYVVDDVGSDFFQNYGIRLGVCPVLLDYPSVYELDGKNLYCNREDPDTHVPCLGQIDYDAGFNFLVCTKCGKQYQARQLAKQEEEGNIVIKMEGVSRHMSIKLYRGDEVVETIERNPETKVIETRDDKSVSKPKVKVLNKKRFDDRQKRKKDSEVERRERLEKSIEKRAKTIDDRIDTVGEIYDAGQKHEEEEKENVRIVNVSDMANPTKQRRFDRVDMRYTETPVEEKKVDDMVKRIQEEATKESIASNIEEVADSKEKLNQANTVSDYKPEKVHSALRVQEEENKEEESSKPNEEIKEIVESAVQEESEEKEQPEPSWNNPTIVEGLNITKGESNEVSDHY